MIDYVANNLAWPGPGSEVVYSNFSAPFNTQSAFHKYCPITDYSNADNYQNVSFSPCPPPMRHC